MPIRTPITDLQASGHSAHRARHRWPRFECRYGYVRCASGRQTLLEKYSQENPEALPGDTALRMATRNGALAMGFEDSGILAEGHPADLILVDFNRPHLRPRHDLVANLVHSAKGADVTHVIVDGKLLMRNRELLTLDEERILYEAEKHAFRMVHQNMNQIREYRA